jgi:hypothetical protein
MHREFALALPQDAANVVLEPKHIGRDIELLDRDRKQVGFLRLGFGEQRSRR